MKMSEIIRAVAAEILTGCGDDEIKMNAAKVGAAHAFAIAWNKPTKKIFARLSKDIAELRKL